MKNIELSLKLSEIDYDQSRSDSAELRNLFPSNEWSNQIKTIIFKPLASASDEIEKKMQHGTVAEIKSYAAPWMQT